MNPLRNLVSACVLLSILTTAHVQLWAQAAPEKETQQIQQQLAELKKAVAELKKGDDDVRRGRLIADVEVYAKAAEWILRHKEFYKPNYAEYALQGLQTGLERAKDLAAGKSPWINKPGSVIQGYYSKVDNSVQPYALALPKNVNPRGGKRYPLHVRLHGRGGTRNEARFIHDHDNKPLAADQTWIQLDVFGRTDNAYRWSGETDVFEAIADVSRRYRIDSRRITLWGFSMGGAGSWHLGLHYPSFWSSVGPGAGFVDFYEYQKQTQRRPPYQHSALHIYDAVDYTLNAFNVPVCTYGGELDKQLIASTSVVEKAKRMNVPMKLLIGPGVGHKFHPETFKEFMAFHLEHSKTGRRAYPGNKEVRFITYTLKYNKCEWLTIEEMLEMYKPAIVQGRVDANTGTLKIKTQNVAVLQIARDIASQVEIDGTLHKLNSAADGLLPGVFYELGTKEWHLMDYETSRAFTKNPEKRKRHNLQGPIDDAFMEPFVCVTPTGESWSKPHADWANWTLARFQKEFDKWLRGKVPTTLDRRVLNGEMLNADYANKNLILFGDPGSNSVLAKVLPRLPIEWTKDTLVVHGKKYDPNTHGLSMIFPNPLNPNRYIVINSGHTFHEKDFRASNSWLFPRLGDIAVQKFAKNKSGGYDETIIWADMFNPSWRLIPPDQKSAALSR